jgi:hypothetical protein
MWICRRSSRPCLTKNKVQVKVKVKAKAEATQTSTSTSTLAFIRMSISCLMSDLSLTNPSSRGRAASRTEASRCAAIAAVLLLLAATGRLFGAPVTFDAVAPLPGQENFKYLWGITVHNPGPETVSVSFKVEARDAAVGSVFSAKTQPLVLAPGDSKLTASDIKLTEVSCKEGYEAFTRPGRVLPEGDYTYAITLDPRMPQAAFFLRVRATKPVGLAWPLNGAVVTDTQPVFVWTPPVVSGPIVAYQYALRVVELGRGQAGLAAVRRNRPVFEDSRVSTTAYRIPVRTAFAAGRAYAWRVAVTDTAGSPADTGRTQSQAGSFVYKPAAVEEDTSTSFAFLTAGSSVAGNAWLVVNSDVPDAEFCVLEYVLGSDSTSQDWHVIGSFTRAERSFVGTWSSDSAVLRVGKAFPMPAIVRATVLGSKGQRSRSALLPLVINKPPPPTRRGCGC